MMKALLRVERDNMKKKSPEFSVGDTVRVHVKVIEGEKVRSQVFQGTVIGRRGGGLRETFIVRKISANIAVERIFPVHSPNVVKIERIRMGRVRRAQLTYMKDRKGKRARIAGLRVESKEAPEATAEATPPPEPETVPADAPAEAEAGDAKTGEAGDAKKTGEAGETATTTE